MANLWLKNLLGQIPATEKIETAHNQLVEEHNRVQQIEESEELKKYRELEAYLQSDEFLKKKKEVEAITYKGSEEEKLINELQNIKNDNEIKLYFKTLESPKIKRFSEIETGEKLARFEEIKETIESGQVNDIKKQMDADYKAEVDKTKKLKSLKKNPELKKYFKLIQSPDYKTYKEILESDILKEFNEIKKKVDAFDYSKVNKENEEDFKEQLQAKERASALENDPKLKVYLKFVSAKQPEFIDKISNGDLLNEFEALDIYLNSDEYTQKLKETNFKESDLYKLEQEYKQLKKDGDIKFYYKFQNSKEYQNYIKIKDSDKLKRYHELKETTESQEFQEKVEYLKDDKKFEKTDEYEHVKTFNELKNSENISWYFKVKDTDRFKPITDWELVFNEDFEGSKYDDQIWEPVIFQGLVSINDNYAIKGEKQRYTKGENIRIDQSALNIETRKESAQGKAWSPKSGFTDQNFDFTSGTLNTAKAFRFNTGRLEAKISVQQSDKIVHGFSLKGDTITPHIDLMKTGKGNGFEVRYIPKEQDKQPVAHKVKGININEKYLIYKLNWTEKELVWYINDIEVAREPHQLNGDMLYINLASIVEKTPETLPAAYSLDWIKVYKKQES